MKSPKINLDFQKINKITSKNQTVIPVVIQENTTKEVLILGYTNEIAFEKTLETNLVHLWSTSKNQLWLKGQTSGNYLELVEVRVNCENNSLLYLVNLKGDGACHEKDKNGKHYRSCFFRTIT